MRDLREGGVNIGDRVWIHPRLELGTVVDLNQGQSMVCVTADSGETAYFPLGSLEEIVTEDGELVELTGGRIVVHGQLRLPGSELEGDDVS